MLVSNFMEQVGPRQKKNGRKASTYRGARREQAKQVYRLWKKHEAAKKRAP